MATWSNASRDGVPNEDEKPPLFPYDLPRLQAKYWKPATSAKAAIKPHSMVSSQWYQHFGGICPVDRKKGTTIWSRCCQDREKEFPGFVVATPYDTSIYEIRPLPTQRDVENGETKGVVSDERPRLLYELATPQDVLFQPISMGESAPDVAWGFRLHHSDDCEKDNADQSCGSNATSIIAVLRGSMIEYIDAKSGTSISIRDVMGELEQSSCELLQNPTSIHHAGSSAFVFTCNYTFAVHDIGVEGLAFHAPLPSELQEVPENLCHSVCPIGDASSYIHVTASNNCSKSLCIAPFMATGHGDGVVRIWETRSLSVLTTIQTHGPIQIINELSLCPDGKQLLVQKEGYGFRRQGLQIPNKTSAFSDDQLLAHPWVFSSVRNFRDGLKACWPEEERMAQEFLGAYSAKTFFAPFEDLSQFEVGKRFRAASSGWCPPIVKACSCASTRIATWIERAVSSAVCGQFLILDIQSVLEFTRGTCMTLDDDLYELFTSSGSKLEEQHNILRTRSFTTRQISTEFTGIMPSSWSPCGRYIATGSKSDRCPLLFWELTVNMSPVESSLHCGVELTSALSFNFNMCEKERAQEAVDPNDSFCLSVSLLPHAVCGCVAAIDCRSDRVTLFGRGADSPASKDAFVSGGGAGGSIRVSGSLMEYDLIDQIWRQQERRKRSWVHPSLQRSCQLCDRERAESYQNEESNSEGTCSAGTSSVSFLFSTIREELMRRLGVATLQAELAGASRKSVVETKISNSVFRQYRHLASKLISYSDIAEDLDRICYGSASERAIEEDDEDGEEIEGWRQAVEEHHGNFCSWERGYCNQQVYVCITCMRRQMYQQAHRRREERSSRPAKARRVDSSSVPAAASNDTLEDFRAFPLAFCGKCIQYCHQSKGHVFANIGMKQNVRCDCGTRRMQLCMKGMNPHAPESYDDFSNPDYRCELCPSKENDNATETSNGNSTDTHPCFRENRENRYDHSYFFRFCYCNRVEERPMVQCCFCDDWFHSICIHNQEDNDVDVTMEPFLSCEFMCEDCRFTCLPFLDEQSLQTAAEAIADEIAAMENAHDSQGQNSSERRNVVGIKLGKGVLLYSSWSQRLGPQHQEHIERLLEAPETYSYHRYMNEVVNEGMLLAPVEEQLRADQEAESSGSSCLSATERARLFAGPDGDSEQVDPTELMRNALSGDAEAGVETIFRTFYTNTVVDMIRNAANEGRETITEEQVREYFRGRNAASRRNRER
eukprot:gb/GECG01005395.1/.p1 GENE.gb/GECG01005395.1/~~gb/GECG01005395.1/.p1  ORF type:complete len:1229 (+),score=152.95 gb/GECG01005395.1/:1-3687(+)